LGLRAVIFDFGMVLTGLPDKEAHDAMVRMTGLSIDQFEELYWADRHAYDEGKLTGVTFWQKFGRDSGLSLTPADLDRLNELDARMWTTCDPEMVSWQQRLRQHGLRTAILSNMGDSVLENIERKFAWIHNFDVLIWSFQHGIAKPDPAIYRLTLERLGTEPGKTLFIDDKHPNIEAALALGMKAIEFKSVAQLRRDLDHADWDHSLPLP